MAINNKSAIFIMLCGLAAILGACHGDKNKKDTAAEAGGGDTRSDATISAKDGSGDTRSDATISAEDGSGDTDSDATISAEDGSGDTESDVTISAEDGGNDTRSGATISANRCTRETLKAKVDDYFAALQAHDPSRLSFASTVKFTENGKETTIGEGLWKTAGAVKFERSAFDTESCNSVTESTITEGSTDIIFGLRLKLVKNTISEVETIVVRSGDYISSPAGLADTASDDWETILADDERPTREELAEVVDTYFILFPFGACDFADDCTRCENGLAVGSCTSLLYCGDAGSDAGSRSMTPRLHVLDVEAGIAVGFTMFTGKTIPGVYTDFHMFKFRDGKVHRVHTTLATATESGWE
jgi:hypothetical protein